MRDRRTQVRRIMADTWMRLVAESRPETIISPDTLCTSAFTWKRRRWR